MTDTFAGYGIDIFSNVFGGKTERIKLKTYLRVGSEGAY